MRNALLLAAAAMAFAGAAATNTANDPMRALPTAGVAYDVRRKAVRSGGLAHLQGGYRRGPGWSYAHVKRMARKARNQAQNRAHHRAHCKGCGK